MAKVTEPWFVRVSIPTIARIERLMEDFGYKSRAHFLDDALTVLQAVKDGAPLPDCIKLAQQRRLNKGSVSGS